MKYLVWDSKDELTEVQTLISSTVHEWYGAKHRNLSLDEICFINNNPIVTHAKYPVGTSKFEGINHMIKTERRTGCGYPDDDEYFFLRLFDAGRRKIHYCFTQDFVQVQKLHKYAKKED